MHDKPHLSYEKQLRLLEERGVERPQPPALSSAAVTGCVITGTDPSTRLRSRAGVVGRTRSASMIGAAVTSTSTRVMATMISP